MPRHEMPSGALMLLILRVLRSGALHPVLLLALVIGVNIAAFGFFDLMFLRPLPVRDPGTLIGFQRSAPGVFSDNFVYPEMPFYREHSKTLSVVLASTDAKLTIDGEEKQLNASFVTVNFFSELGATARLGRMFDPVRD